MQDGGWLGAFRVIVCDLLSARQSPIRCFIVDGVRLIHSHPRLAICLNDLASAYQAEGRTDEAVKLKEEVVKLYKTSGDDGGLDVSTSPEAGHLP
jgi:hypothetical protein